MMGYAYTTLWPVLKTNMTKDVLSSIQSVGGESFIDNFLGRDDINLLNKTVVTFHSFSLEYEVTWNSAKPNTLKNKHTQEQTHSRPNTLNTKHTQD